MRLWSHDVWTVVSTGKAIIKNITVEEVEEEEEEVEEEEEEEGEEVGDIATWIH